MQLDEYSGDTEAALHDNRFRNGFSIDDEFQDLELLEGSFDIGKLKTDVEGKANRRSGEILRKQPRHRKPLQEEIWDVITCKRFRKGPLAFAESGKCQMIEKIKRSIDMKEPLLLTLSFFPAKIVNPLKTFAQTGGEVDLGEVAAILRLYEITKTLSLLYSPGAKIVITQDGLKYHDVFDVSISAAQEYAKRIREIIEYLGVSDFIEIVEETEIYPANYPEVRASCISEIADLYRGCDPETVALVTKLRCNIALSLALNNVEMRVDVLALVFNHNLDDSELLKISPYAHQLRMEIKARSLEATIQYIGTYNAPYKCGIYDNHLPSALKCTVHPKKEQLGLYPTNATANLFPHHGQGHMSSRNVHGIDEVRLSFAADIRRSSGQKQVGIILPTNNYPFSDGKHPFTIVKV